MKDNQSYYDDFAAWYERERHFGYHALLDRLQIEIAKPMALGRDLLEIGCGTGMILKELAPVAQRAIGLDISAGMLEQARDRGLKALQGSATDLPFPQASFDVVVSFKVLAHVKEIWQALSEVSRVLRPGGVAALEFYNTRSLRYLIKRLKPAQAISEQSDDTHVFTRYDSLEDIKGYLPPALRLTGIRGIRVWTPFAQIHRVPLLNRGLAHLERFSRDQPISAQFGGFLVVLLERV